MGCGGDDDDESPPADPTDPAAPADPAVPPAGDVAVPPAADDPAAASTLDFKGTWNGTYDSENGSSAMRLNVQSGPDAGGTYAGQFSFTAGKAGSLFCVQKGNYISMRLTAGDWWMGVEGSVNDAGTQYQGDWFDGNNNEGTMTLNR